jgi:hypothetical protein
MGVFSGEEEDGNQEQGGDGEAEERKDARKEDTNKKTRMLIA